VSLVPFGPRTLVRGKKKSPTVHQRNSEGVRSAWKEGSSVKSEQNTFSERGLEYLKSLNGHQERKSSFLSTIKRFCNFGGWGNRVEGKVSEPAPGCPTGQARKTAEMILKRVRQRGPTRPRTTSAADKRHRRSQKVILKKSFTIDRRVDS